MTKRVRPDGRVDARFVLIGEAPGQHEVRAGRPFVGPAGALQAEFWHGAGLKRHDFRIYNVYEYMAPKSKVELAPRDEVDAWAGALHKRLGELTDPWVIVPTGNVALRACMRKPLWAPASPKIGDWRGSIMSYTFDDGRACKMIPTIHPAAVLREPSVGKLCRLDWRRIALEGRTRTAEAPKRFHIVPPVSKGDVDWYKMMSRDAAQRMAIDIETNPREGALLCVGFSVDPSESLTLQWPENKGSIRELCESPCTKVGQNFLYDRYWLKRVGIDVRGPIYDLLSMHHALDSTLPHDLACMASLDTRQPFWKKSHKDMDSPDAVEKTPLDRLYVYNGIDCCVTRELFDVYYGRLKGVA